MNKYFTSIASKLNECDNGLTIEPIPNYTDYVKNSVKSSIYLSECSSEEIKKIIKELSPNKASDIPITVLKHISTITSPILANFYNAFMSSGTFPNVLKTGIVSPVYKKGTLSNLITIDLFQLFQYLANYLKNLYINLFIAFLLQKTYSMKNNLGFEKIIQS